MQGRIFKVPGDRRTQATCPITSGRLQAAQAAQAAPPPSGTGGFSFGAPKPTTAAASPAFGAPAAVAAAAPIAGFSFGAMSEDWKQPSHDDNDDMAGRSFNCSVCSQDLAPPDEVMQRHPELLRHLREDCPYRRKGYLPIGALVSKNSLLKSVCT